ncbi:hypothetical protein Tco_0203880 [Tanacetum coccineum]
MEAQYGKFLDMILAVRINVPLVDVLAGMPNSGKFLKELVDKKGYQSQKEQKQAKIDKKRKRQVQERDLNSISKAGSRPWSRKDKKAKENDHFALTMED